MADKSLNILQVGSAFGGWGGTELHMLNLSTQLARRGHRVTIACRPGRYVEEQARQRGIRTVSAKCRRQNHWFPLPRYLQIMRAEPYDVVHVHWDSDYKIPPTAARLCKVPVVLMSHHSPYKFSSATNRWLYGKVLFHRIIALSESVRGLLLSEGVPPNKVTTIHHGTDVAAFQSPTLSPESVWEDWRIPPDAVLAGMVGRIGREKGVLDFLKALSYLKDTNIHAVLVGEGPQDKEARLAVEELGLAKRVTFAGFRNDVNNAVNAIDIQVVASVWEEPCSAAIQQAMALSKPVIGTRTGGTPEMIVDGETGLLVPPSNPKALAAAIKKLAEDGPMRQRLGAAGCARVEAHFSLSVMVDKIEALYLREYEAACAARALRKAVASRA